MKHVYFVRHGETEANVRQVVQGLDDPLTLEGERQILRIGERARGIDVDVLISSDTVRTNMTAGAIANTTGKTIEFSPLFREVRRPTSLIGFSWQTDEYKNFTSDSNAHLEDPDWHQEDEENFFDAQRRAGEAIAYLNARPEEDLLVVTHGLFLKHMLAQMVLGDMLTPSMFIRWNFGFRTSNTGITICEQKEGEEKWTVVSWNDHAHFAD